MTILFTTVGKNPSKKWNSKKVKWLSEEALQIDEERREVESKGEREDMSN